jgi:hypothetical protein
MKYIRRKNITLDLSFLSFSEQIYGMPSITTFDFYANLPVYNKFIEHDMPFYRFLIYLNDAMRLNLIFINDA